MMDPHVSFRTHKETSPLLETGKIVDDDDNDAVIDGRLVMIPCSMHARSETPRPVRHGC
jgi:hypothetical protein